MITCQINNQSLVTVYDEVVADSVEYLIASFTFSDDWDGYSRTVIFSNYSNNKVLVVTLIDGDSLYLGNNKCYVPHEVIESPGFSISVFGVKDESVITTDEKNIVVRKSGYKRGETPEKPTPTDVERIIGIATSAKNVADSVRQDADEGKFDGKDGAPGEKGDKGDKGDPVETDEHYDPLSENAQSGIAVSEAVFPKLDKRTKEELDNLTNIVQDQLYMCTSYGELKNCTIINEETNEVFQGYLYEYNGNSSYTQINTMPLPEMPESIQVTGEWLNNEHSSEYHRDKIYQCITTEYGFIQGYFYLSVNCPETGEYYWQQLNVQPTSGGGAVTSVNGKTGDVVLDAEDVGAVRLVSGEWLDTNSGISEYPLPIYQCDSTYPLNQEPRYERGCFYEWFFETKKPHWIKIPTYSLKLSECINDVGFVTDTYHDSTKQNVPTVVKSGTSFIIKDNTLYHLTNVTDLTIRFPVSSGYPSALFRIKTAASGTINITLPSNTRFIGDVPTFGNDEIWEISFYGLTAVCGKAV